MTARCSGWVFDHSEARGYDRLVLLALADAADDDGLNAYPSQRTIAAKARMSVSTVRLALDRLEAAGEIVVDRPERQGRGHYSRYVVLMGREPGELERHRDSAPSAGRQTRGNARERARALPGAALTPDPVIPPQGDDKQVGEPATDAGRLAGLLADAVTEHRAGTDRPAVTEHWIRDMRLLLERGPAELAKPEAVAAARVERAIGFLFRNLAQPGTDGFCWADQVRSPAALRKHWTRIRDAARTLDRRRFADLHHSEAREAERTAEAGALLKARDCAEGLCDGRGWLEEEFDPFNPKLASERGPVRPCPSCRPQPKEATP